jgi:prepilin-type N-terminal cleavage/methylation domain-containing protein
VVTIASIKSWLLLEPKLNALKRHRVIVGIDESEYYEGSMVYKPHKIGFTLIELLLVIGIIGILGTVVLIAVNPSKALCEANNTRRVSDTNTVTKAWQQYLIMSGTGTGLFPAGFGNRIPICQSGVISSTCVSPNYLIGDYLGAMPVDNDEQNSNYSGYDGYIDHGNRVTVVAHNMIGNCANRCTPRDSSLIGYWRFDETTQGAATDSTTYRRHGDYGNSPSPSTVVAPLRFGNPGSMLFARTAADASKDYVTLSTTESSTFKFGSTQDFTLSLWMKTQTGSYYHDIVSNESYTNRTGFALSMIGSVEPANDGKPFFHSRNSCCPAAMGSVSVKNNLWHHLVGVRSGNNALLYVDGVLAASTTGAAVDFASAFNLNFGKDPNNGFPYTGYLDDVRIYNRALAASEIYRLSQGYCE